MVRSLARLIMKPVELVTILNELLVNDPMDQIFTLSYLTLLPQENQLQFISCGYGNLWHVPTGVDQPRKISADNIALGIDADTEFLQVGHAWNVGDTLVLNTFAAIAEKKATGDQFTEDDFKQALMDNLYKPPQKQVETIFRKARTFSSQAFVDRSLTLIGVQRTA